MQTGLGFAQLDPDPADRFVTLRRTLGVTTMGINQIVMQPGQRGRIHAHAAQEEVFLVLEGTLSLLAEGAEHEVVTGGLVRVAPQVRRQLVNRGPARLVLLALGAAHAHDGRDGLAYRDWDDAEPRSPQEIPLPDDLPPGEIRN